MIIGFILAMICIIYWLLIIMTSGKDDIINHTQTYSNWKITSSFISILMGILFVILTTEKIQEKSTSIDCLKGKNPYKMEIKYTKVNDSTYIPVDTNYIKK